MMLEELQMDYNLITQWHEAAWQSVANADSGYAADTQQDGDLL
jgi:hypothetical protein